MVNFRSQRCAHGTCKKPPKFNFEGRKKAYCKLHADNGMVDVCAKHLKASRTVVGAAPRLPTFGALIVYVQPKREILDGPVSDEREREAMCEAAVCLKLSRSGLHGEQSTRCLDDAPIPDGLGHAADVELARIKGKYRPPSHRSLPARLTDSYGGSGGTAAKRPRQRFYRRPLSP